MDISLFIKHDHEPCKTASRYKGPVLDHFYFRSAILTGPEVEMTQNRPFISTMA